MDWNESERIKREEEWLVSMKKEKVETEERACPKLFARHLTSASSEKEENTFPGNHFSLCFGSSEIPFGDG
uniref:Uncharacterized protein n=1 Tax=Onchocerca volvulus TaxID=6282 RepID=A0A8R1TZG2_ONCVO